MSGTSKSETLFSEKQLKEAQTLHSRTIPKDQIMKVLLVTWVFKKNLCKAPQGFLLAGNAEISKYICKFLFACQMTCKPNQKVPPYPLQPIEVPCSPFTKGNYRCGRPFTKDQERQPIYINGHVFNNPTPRSFSSQKHNHQNHC